MLTATPLLYATGSIIGNFDYTLISPLPSFVPQASDPGSDSDSQMEEGSVVAEKTMGEEYWESDGVVPMISQWHPMECRCVILLSLL